MEREEVPRIDEPINHTFLVESIDVMESELKKGGPKYTILESLKLGE
jgi:2'-5' RNA ligase